MGVISQLARQASAMLLLDNFDFIFFDTSWSLFLIEGAVFKLPQPPVQHLLVAWLRPLADEKGFLGISRAPPCWLSLQQLSCQRAFPGFASGAAL